MSLTEGAAPQTARGADPFCHLTKLDVPYGIFDMLFSSALEDIPGQLLELYADLHGNQCSILLDGHVQIDKASHNWEINGKVQTPVTFYIVQKRIVCDERLYLLFG
ncbi:hypothetical protein E2542_SST09261 [Spatholobus suberectus]|nr:hypothetical protein E2542_SST09261 [Spatholobus suberectus]